MEILSSSLSNQKYPKHYFRCPRYSQECPCGRPVSWVEYTCTYRAFISPAQKKTMLIDPRIEESHN